MSKSRNPMLIPILCDNCKKEFEISEDKVYDLVVLCENCKELAEDEEI